VFRGEVVKILAILILSLKKKLLIFPSLDQNAGFGIVPLIV
jgi:hypothetical protein